MNGPAAYPQSDGPPAKIMAAMHFLQFAEGARSGRSCGVSSEFSTSRELSKSEAEVYDSALTTLLEYFNEPGVGQPAQQGDEPPDGKERQKVPA